MDELTLENIIKILEEIHPGVDYTADADLIEEGLLTSLDIAALINKLDEKLFIRIPPKDILPDNFASAQAILDLLLKLDEE